MDIIKISFCNSCREYVVVSDYERDGGCKKKEFVILFYLPYFIKGEEKIVFIIMSRKSKIAPEPPEQLILMMNSVSILAHTALHR